MSRLTMPNMKMHPRHKQTYRAPMYDQGMVIDHNCMFGQLVDKLGEYEDLGTVEELRKLIKEKEK